MCSRLSFLHYKWICLPLSRRLVSISSNTVVLSEHLQSSGTRHRGRCFTVQARAHVAGESLRSLLPTLCACVLLNQRESGWFLRKWNSTGDNLKARVQLRHTPTPPLSTSLHSLCHQGDIAKGAPVIFFFSSGLESRQWICTINYLASFGVGAWKRSFASDHMPQMSPY